MNFPNTFNYQKVPKQLLWIICLILTWPSFYAQSPREICEMAADLVKLNDSEMISTLTIIDKKGRKRERKITSARQRFGASHKMIMQFIEPAEVAGTAMLIYDHDNKDDDMWIFMPALQKTRRIVSKDKSKNFMGSEFRNADMSESDPDNFIYESLGSELYFGQSQHKIKVTCFNEKIRHELGYEYKIMWVDKNNFLTTAIHYFNQSKLLRKQTFTDYQLLSDGKYYAKQMTMENVVNKRRSVLSIDNIQTGAYLSELYFSPAKLPDL